MGWIGGGRARLARLARDEQGERPGRRPAPNEARKIESCSQRGGQAQRQGLKNRGVPGEGVGVGSVNPAPSRAELLSDNHSHR